MKDNKVVWGELPMLINANEDYMDFVSVNDNYGWFFRSKDYKNLNKEFNDFIDEIIVRWFGNENERNSRLEIERANHFNRLKKMNVNAQFKFIIKYMFLFQNWVNYTSVSDCKIVNRNFKLSNKVEKTIDYEKMRTKLIHRIDDIHQLLLRRDVDFIKENYNEIKEIQIRCEKLLAKK